MLLLLVVAAHADDGVWVGGAASAVGGFTVNEQNPLSLRLQAEANLNISAGIFSADIDVDAHFNPLANEFLAPEDMITWCPGDYILSCPRPIEQATFTLADGSWRVSAGLINPAIGIETWDEWQNPLPVFTQTYALQPSQIAGGEFGWTFGEEGPEVSVYGGMDWGWYGDDGFPTPEVGATVSYSGDTFGTYNGAWAMPAIQNYGGLASAQIQPSDLFRVDLSVSPGYIGGDSSGGYVGGWAAIGFFPDGMINPIVRAQGVFDPNQVVTGQGFPTAVGELGANFKPVDFLNIQLEGRVSLEGQAVTPGVIAGVSIFRPEPE